MSKLRLRVALYFIGLILGLGSSSLALSTPIDEWYDTYQNISWSEEKAHLFSFAVFLQRNPEMSGYIAFCGKDRRELRTKKARAARAKKYLISNLKIAKKRIILVNGQTCDVSITILQPIAKGVSPPRFF